jgi:uncharacterized protein (DUF3820 family)
MKYLDIAIANETIKTTDIKGKDYAEVNQRIKAFRMNHPLGSIKTNIESLENGVVVMSCEVKDELGNLLGKAYAYEKEDSSFINKTSFIENCCTSCTGRALGYAGYGIDVSVASAEEVQNAINNQVVTQEEADNYKLTFGKHTGKTLKEVPKEYVEWLLGNTKDERMIKLIELATGLTIPSEEEQKEIMELMTKIQDLSFEKNIDLEEVKEKFKVDSITNMSIEQMRKCVKAMEKKGE